MRLSGAATLPSALPATLPKTPVMSSAVEYLFAASVTIAHEVARKRGWRQCSRAAWIKVDGTTHFICFKEQLAALPPGVKVHRVSLPPCGPPRGHEAVSEAASASWE